MKKKTITVAKGKKLSAAKEHKLKAKPGGSNTGKYKNIKSADFAGKSGGTSPYSFPINTLARARNALARAHFAPNPEGIRAAVYRKYPQLKMRHEER